MAKLSDSLTRESVLEFLASSALYGNLGAFVGAGLSKAVLNQDGDEIAMSWGDLLAHVAETLDVDYGGIWKEGVSYPDIASEICRIYAAESDLSYTEALADLKREIAANTAWYPSKEQRERFSDDLVGIGLNWIITTNYDLVIESLMLGASIPLGPNDPLIAPRGIVPVYHLHGVRTNPDEIIIAQEDYVGLFRPTEYRQIKLALMIKESTMVIIGYGLSDVNVLTALDWSKNVYKGKRGSYPNEVVQVVRKNTPQEEPYRDNNSVVLIEVSSLESFFRELTAAKEAARKEEDKLKQDLRGLSDTLEDPDGSVVDRFIDEQEFRDDVLKTLGRFSNELISGFVSFLDRCIDVTWQRSAPHGAFHGYADNLNMILDILTAFKVDQIPPALFETTAYALQRVSPFVGQKTGTSWEAGRVWHRRKGEMTQEMVEEMLNFAGQHHYTELRRMAKDAQTFNAGDAHSSCA